MSTGSATRESLLAGEVNYETAMADHARNLLEFYRGDRSRIFSVDGDLDPYIPENLPSADTPQLRRAGATGHPPVGPMCSAAGGVRQVAPKCAERPEQDRHQRRLDQEVRHGRRDALVSSCPANEVRRHQHRRRHQADRCAEEPGPAGSHRTTATHRTAEQEAEGCHHGGEDPEAAGLVEHRPSVPVLLDHQRGDGDDQGDEDPLQHDGGAEPSGGEVQPVGQTTRHGQLTLGHGRASPVHRRADDVARSAPADDAHPSADHMRSRVSGPRRTSRPKDRAASCCAASR